jgi:hypothetical protein
LLRECPIAENNATLRQAGPLNSISPAKDPLADDVHENGNDANDMGFLS